MRTIGYTLFPTPSCLKTTIEFNSTQVLRKRSEEAMITFCVLKTRQALFVLKLLPISLK